MRQIKGVTPLNDFEIELLFDNGETRIFDVKPYIEKGIFTQLKNPEYFKKVTVCLDSIQWPNGQDFDPDHLYIESLAKEGSHQDDGFQLPLE